MLRFLERLLAAFVAVGMVVTGYILFSESLEPRERVLMGAALLMMGIFVWACVGPPLRGWWRRAVIAVFAASLLVVFTVMLRESGSIPAWAGLLLFANLAGIAMFVRAPALQR
jgi:hypothetical protein